MLFDLHQRGLEGDIFFVSLLILLEQYHLSLCPTDQWDRLTCWLKAVNQKLLRPHRPLGPLHFYCVCTVVFCYWWDFYCGGTTSFLSIPIDTINVWISCLKCLLWSSWLSVDQYLSWCSCSLFFILVNGLWQNVPCSSFLYICNVKEFPSVGHSQWLVTTSCIL